MIKNFLECLSERVLLCDGAMGTMLYARGIFINSCFDELNLGRASLVKDIHDDYLAAGAEVIETNTFGANRYKLASFGLEDKVKEINIEGVKIAKAAAGNKAFIAGSVGPLGKPLAPLGKISQDQALAAFKEQIQALLESGVDLIMIETISDMLEMRIALQAASEVIREIDSIKEIPIVTQMTLGEDGQTLMGDRPLNMAKSLLDWGAQVVGFNCSQGPAEMIDSVDELIIGYQRALSIKAEGGISAPNRISELSGSKSLSGKVGQGTGLLVVAQPNAGSPRMVDGRFIYLSSPEYFAEFTKRFILHGVRLVGGCCGTTPEHIRAMSRAIKALQPSASLTVAIAEDLIEFEEDVEIVPTCQKSPFAAKLGKEFVTCVEIDPPRGSSKTKALKAAEALHAAGIDAINIADSPRATARMSPLALALIIQQQVGIQTILHYTCRDRNLLGMQSDLLGAHALGLQNLLLITGDPPKLGDYPNATAVFDIDSIGLVRLVNLLNHGHDLANNKIGPPTCLLIGVGVNPTAIDYDTELRRFEQKIRAGAEFAMTQPIFEPEIMNRFLTDIKSYPAIPIIIGILPLVSSRNAEFLHHEVPDILIPDRVREAMRKAADSNEALSIGVRLAQEVLLAFKDKVQGVYVMPPFNKVELALQVLEVLK